MVKYSKIIKKFGAVTAVDIDSFIISNGEIVGLIGNNGAGKTTLFNLTLDLLKPDQGHITSKDLDIQGTDHWKTYTSSYLNERFLIGFLKPDEYFELIAYMYKIDNIKLHKRLSVFRDFMNGEILGSNKLIRQLSSGNKQKVGIVGAFIPDSELIILDEPFNFLDPRSQIIFKQLIKDSNHFKDSTYFISSHNLNHVSEICTRIILMEKGKIIKDVKNCEYEINEINNYFNFNIF